MPKDLSTKWLSGAKNGQICGMEGYPPIVMLCPFGDEVKRVALYFDYWGDKAWHLTIGGYHWGRLHKIGGEWRYYLHESCLFTTDDFQLLVEAIEKHLWRLSRRERRRSVLRRSRSL